MGQRIAANMIASALIASGAKAVLNDRAGSSIEVEVQGETYTLAVTPVKQYTLTQV